MKTSIRTKFTIGIVFLFVIISVLSLFSAIFLTRLSEKTSAIFKDNHASVIYVRDMSEGLFNINLEITNCYLTNKKPDSSSINKELGLFAHSLQLEKNNITEPGEDKLAYAVETGFKEYRDSVMIFLQSPKPVTTVLSLQLKFGNLYHQLILLSQINEKAIEHKTDEAKVSAKNALKQMTLLGTLCFLFSLSFTFRFASYFNERFFQLYNGIKEIVASNYGQRLHFEGNDEFHEISLVFNEMAEQLNENKKKMDLTLVTETGKDLYFNDVQEVKRLLARLKNIEEQSIQLIARLEKKS
ncbi:MAG: MCP four helix bundle domain-containing protein [Bacteroidales bacterium]|jgi:methyl-accepting chemotaxis protein